MTQKAVTPFTGSKDLARRHDRRVPLRVGRAPAGGGISGRVFRLGGTVTW